MNAIFRLMTLSMIVLFINGIPLNVKTSDPENGRGLFVYTEVTQDADRWVQENGDFFVASVIGGADHAYERYLQFSIGCGIRVINFDDAKDEVPYYLYPVADSGNIIYVLRVYDGKNGFEAIISQILAQELNQLALKTTAEHPAMIGMINENLVWIQDGDAKVLFASPDSAKVFDAKAQKIVEAFSDSINSSGKIQDFAVVNATQGLAGVGQQYSNEAAFIEGVLHQSTVIGDDSLESPRSSSNEGFVLFCTFVVLSVAGLFLVKRLKQGK